MADQTLGSAVLILKTDSSQFEAGMEKAKEKTVEVKDRFLEVVEGAKLVGEAFKKAGEFVMELVNEYAKAELASTRLGASIHIMIGDYDQITTRLVRYAEQLQKSSGFTHEQIENQMSTAVTLGRTEDQVKSLSLAATELANAGVMPLDQAFQALDLTYEGNIRALGKMFPELKKLTTAQLENGDAVKVIEDRVHGMNEALADTTDRKMRDFKNSVDELKEAGGELMVAFVTPWMEGLKSIVAWMASAIEKQNELKRAMDNATAKGDIGTLNTQITALQGLLASIGNAQEDLSKKGLGSKIWGALKMAGGIIYNGIIGGLDTTPNTYFAARDQLDKLIAARDSLEKAWYYAQEHGLGVDEAFQISGIGAPNKGAPPAAARPVPVHPSSANEDPSEGMGGIGAEGTAQLNEWGSGVVGMIGDIGMGFQTLGDQFERVGLVGKDSFASIVAEAQKMQQVVSQLASDLARMVAQNIVQGLFNLGSALGQGTGAAGAILDTIQTMLANLPGMLLAAGLQAIIQPGGLWPGLGLIAAAGGVAIVGGLISGGIQHAQDTTPGLGTIGSGTGGSGAGASYSKAPDQYFTINISGNDIVGDGGFRELAQRIQIELTSLGVANQLRTS